MQIMVKQWPEMVEGSSRYDPPKVNFGTPRKDQKRYIHRRLSEQCLEKVYAGDTNFPIGCLAGWGGA